MITKASNIFFVVLVFSAFSLISSSSCPNGTIEEVHGKKCYWFSQFLDTWNEAEKYCENRNSHLASIPDAFVNSFLLNATQYNYIWGYEGYFWVGMIRNNNTWNWVDGDTSSYTNWNKGQPTQNMIQNNVGLYVASGGTWFNLDGANDHAPFICQNSKT